MRGTWRARCAATDDLILAGITAVVAIVFLVGFLLFVFELAELLSGGMLVAEERV